MNQFNFTEKCKNRKFFLRFEQTLMKRIFSIQKESNLIEFD